MTDSKKTATYDLPIVPVTIIGTKAEDIPAPGTVATTPKPTQPNLIVNVVTPTVAILIRFINAYLTLLVGLVSAGMTTSYIPATDFADLLLKCATLSLSGAGLGLLKDCVTVFGQLERKFPLASGSV